MVYLGPKWSLFLTALNTVITNVLNTLVCWPHFCWLTCLSNTSPIWHNPLIQVVLYTTFYLILVLSEKWLTPIDVTCYHTPQIPTRSPSYLSGQYGGCSFLCLGQRHSLLRHRSFYCWAHLNKKIRLIGIWDVLPYSRSYFSKLYKGYLLKFYIIWKLHCMKLLV